MDDAFNGAVYRIADGVGPCKRKGLKLFLLRHKLTRDGIVRIITLDQAQQCLGYRNGVRRFRLKKRGRDVRDQSACSKFVNRSNAAVRFNDRNA